MAAMHLLVHPNGSKYWRMQYRFDGKQKMLALGVYPDISLADARTRRDEARKLLANGIDPGNTIPDNRHDVSIRFMDFIRDNPRAQMFEDDLFTIRYFQKGTGHIAFKRLDLVEKMNDIVAKHYPGALPAK